MAFVLGRVVPGRMCARRSFRKYACTTTHTLETLDNGLGVPASTSQEDEERAKQVTLNLPRIETDGRSLQYCHTLSASHTGLLIRFELIKPTHELSGHLGKLAPGEADIF